MNTFYRTERKGALLLHQGAALPGASVLIGAIRFKYPGFGRASRSWRVGLLSRQAPHRGHPMPLAQNALVSRSGVRPLASGSAQD